MEITNTTGLPADSLTASTGDNEQLALTACKITWRLNRDGGLDPVPVEEMWPVYGEPALFEDTYLLPELDYRKNGVDILVFGQAMAPQNNPVSQMLVRIECGTVDHRIVVFGDRQWKKTLTGFKISPPQPFVSMPLTNDRAFGGEAALADDKLAYSMNPDGRGYCVAKKEAAGKPLPNLEDPDQLIAKWNQTPVPACLYKPKGLLLDAEGPNSFEGIGKSDDPMALPRIVADRAFNQTVPGLVCPRGDLGTSLILTGFHAAGNLVFPVPPETSIPGTWGPSVSATIGELESTFPMSISTIIALVEYRVLIVTYLGLFRYLFRPEEKRSATIRWHGDTAIPPDGMSFG